MRTTLAFATLLASWTASVAAGPVWKRDAGGFIGQKHKSHMNANDTTEVIVLMQSNATGEAHELLAELGMTTDAIVRNLTAVKGMVLNVGKECQDALKQMDATSFVEEKVDVQTYVSQKTNAPWGLQRISNTAGASGDPSVPDFTYSFDDTTLGTGVDIYIVDTGVYGQHAIFNTTDGTSRVETGISFTGSTVDGDGHGTHVAGTAAGARFGVAQGANIIPVKVLGDTGSGSSSDTISGMDWVISRHNQRKTQSGFQGSVMSMSWGLSGIAETVDDVVKQASAAGIHISVAAGNDAVDACTSTPALNGGDNSDVVTVGSININNTVSTFSNTGTCVDIYAPGEEVLSSWNTGVNVLNFLSGTSMATPHVSGVMAYLLAQDSSLATDTAGLKAKLKSLSVAKAEGSTAGGPSILLDNGVNGAVAAKSKRSVAGPALEQRWAVHDYNSALRY